MTHDQWDSSSTCLHVEDFSGTTLPSEFTNGWFPASGNRYSGPVNSGETACYDSNNSTVSGGYLHTALHIGTSCGPSNKGGTFPNDGSLVSTYGNTNWDLTPGHSAEALIYIQPNTAGSQNDLSAWAAFWFDGRGTWPQTGEVDVLESLNNGQACAHTHDPTNGGPGICAASGVNFSGWHQYGFDYLTNGSVNIYYDGTKLGNLPLNNGGAPLYGIFDNTYPGAPSGSSIFMRTDWYAIWTD